MKTIFLVLAIPLLFGIYNPSKSQVTLTTAVDFTATDVEGNTINLFSILNSGQYVAMEFWATW
ncbi:MAG: hypothetical protein Kow0068_19050 [Marinilabiliales bacterium]